MSISPNFGVFTFIIYFYSFASLSACNSTSMDKRKLLFLIFPSIGFIEGIIPFNFAFTITPIVPV